jgi:hypothetical protein
MHERTGTVEGNDRVIAQTWRDCHWRLANPSLVVHCYNALFHRELGACVRELRTSGCTCAYCLVLDLLAGVQQQVPQRAFGTVPNDEVLVAEC